MQWTNVRSLRKEKDIRKVEKITKSTMSIMSAGQPHVSCIWFSKLVPYMAAASLTRRFQFMESYRAVIKYCLLGTAVLNSCLCSPWFQQRFWRCSYYHHNSGNKTCMRKQRCRAPSSSMFSSQATNYTTSRTTPNPWFYAELLVWTFSLVCLQRG